MAYMVFIFALSSIPSPPSFPSGMDKGLHYFLYGGLAVVIARALSGGRFADATWGVAVGAALLATIYGVSDEMHQQFVAGRTFEYWDVAADAAGASCGAVAASLWGRMRHDL